MEQVKITEKQALLAISVCCENGWRVTNTVRKKGKVTAISLARGADRVEVFITGKVLSANYVNTTSLKDNKAWRRFLMWCQGGM